MLSLRAQRELSEIIERFPVVLLLAMTGPTFFTSPSNPNRAILRQEAGFVPVEAGIGHPVLGESKTFRVPASADITTKPVNDSWGKA